jgi:flagellar protein FlaG
MSSNNIANAMADQSLYKFSEPKFKSLDENGRDRGSHGITEVDRALKKAQEVAQEVARNVERQKEGSLDVIEKVNTEITQALELLNDILAKTPSKAVISKDKQLNMFIVKITDAASGDIIKEIPSEAMLNLARNLETVRGLLFDKDA